MVDATVQLYRRNFTMFVMLGAILFVPITAMQWTLLGRMGPAPSSSAVFLMWVPICLWWMTGCALISTAASDLYTTGRADLSTAITRTLPRLVPAIGASVLAVVGVIFGFLLFVIPGMVLVLSWFAIPAAAVLEPLGPTASLRRSAALSRGLKGHIALCFTILGLLTGGISLLAQAIGYGVGMLFHGHASILSIEVRIAGAIGTIVFGALPPIMATLLYYDARIRNEGYDIELLARSVGGAAAAAPAPAY
jgi:hypothetical protein